MRGRDKIVSENLDVKGKTVNDIMRWYYDDALIVNRKYQRKLVWTLEEKRLFIDSIINKYPTPSIIVSTYEIKDESGNIKDYYEIIDGLQRLNAIVSFVNNEYGIIIGNKEYFYDMQFTPTALTKKLRGELKQRKDSLSFDVCQDFSGAEIPIILTTQRENRNEKIEQIFGRINSSGRKLSAHDLRQASSIGEFPDLVRRVATDFRGDYTYFDEVHLCDMPKISISNKGLNYGINPDDTFWRIHDIIPVNNLRQSKDEEIIASALAISLLGKGFRINSSSLNSLYCPDTKNFKLIDDKINKIGKNTLERYARDVINQINDIFNSVKSNFTDYLYPQKNASGKDISFIILFCTIYQLNRESYFIKDSAVVAKTLKKYFKSTFDIISSNSSHNTRIEIMDFLYNSLKNVMERNLPRNRNNDDDLLETLLSLSNIESQMVEFKIGISYFENGEINDKEIVKICKTLVAMANTNCTYQKEGYVIIGVANNKQSCKNWKEVYNEMPMSYGNHKIVGITKEAITHFVDVDTYTRRFADLIKDKPITESLKTFILSNYRTVDFQDKVLLIIPTIKQDRICYYDNEFYIREGSKTKHIKENDIKI